MKTKFRQIYQYRNIIASNIKMINVVNLELGKTHNQAKGKFSLRKRVRILGKEKSPFRYEKDGEGEEGDREIEPKKQSEIGGRVKKKILMRISLQYIFLSNNQIKNFILYF